jgi:hypothetical protein
MEIVSFSPATGHCVFVPAADLALFRSHIAQMTSAERDRFAPLSLSAAQPVQGGAHYDVGVQRTHTEVMEFLSHVIIDD